MRIIKVSKIGILLVVIATFIFLFSNVIGFAVENSPTHYSCLKEKSDNETQEMICFVKDNREIRVGIFLVGIITAIIIIFGNIIVEYGHKHMKSYTNTDKVFRAKGYR